MAKITARRILVAMNMRRDLQHFRGTMLISFTVLALSEVVQADNFANVYYSAQKDQLVVTMAYRGTNPDHTFSLKWGQCKDLPNGHAHDIVAEVLDSQWQDAAQRAFKVTTRFSLSDLSCRPATLTLRTAPRFNYTLQIPERATPKP